MPERKLPTISLEGSLEHITFYNKQNHYTVGRLKTGFPKTTVTIVGHLPKALVGETIKLTGKWATHPRYGQQFRFETAEILLPATIDGIRNYLTSGILSGIGPSTSEKIIARFGEQTFAIIEESPEKLTQIDGIGKKKASMIHSQWQSHHCLTTIMKFLQENGIKTVYSGKIYKTYGNEALDIIQQDPYQLANDIPGIDFPMADRIARNLGIEMNVYDRAQACILHILREAIGDGHVFMREKNLLERISGLYEIDSQTAGESLEDLSNSGDIVIESFSDTTSNGRAVYLKPMWQAEHAIANRITALLSIPITPLPTPIKNVLTEVENTLIISLSSEQQKVLEAVTNHRISIITGGPGTGKTTLIKSITEMNRILGRCVCLAAPTGRAARRLSEVTGQKAHTIHKLLEYSFEEQLFGKGPDDPIDADIIIIDEVSMVDTILMYHLLNAIPFNATVIMVGDAHQLPPVGPGNMLSDMIASEKIPVFYLKTIFRQAAESPIIVNAHHVRNGKFPHLNKMNEPFDAQAEFYFIEQHTPENVVSSIVDLCSKKLPDMFNLNPVDDIQVLSPMHKGVAGTINLNRQLQAALNMNSGTLSNGNNRFKVGDKVMHLKNNYQKDVFNGDIGAITQMDKANDLLCVDFYGRNVEYGLEEIDELALGYAISVHKSQGSEYPAVVLPLITQHYIMLQRNLLYTGITRAKKYVVLVGTKKALSIALKNNKPQLRCSGLSDRLCSMVR
ncbi:MAG: ATP-dependent RecD-like DNA helicase [Desulfobacteraceae bacterium]|nr:ATP-dependent RecD-like DNA helicase [Desulfobacteraceae bacterium]MBC2755329.1 ATP-dependent RecD-like DNA helicase [Desulfobacteraceae bacterium]